MNLIRFSVMALSLFATSRAAPGRVVKTTYLGFEAYEVTDGRTRAVVVPELAGRVMAYGWVDGPNLIWNTEPPEPGGRPDGFVNWGGDKTLVGPHLLWKQHSDRRWPPRPSWMSEPHAARVEADGTRLVTTGPAWEGFELRVVRRYAFTEDGGLRITQILEKTDDGAGDLAVWPVAQVRVPDRVYIPVVEKEEEPFRYTNARRDSIPLRRIRPGWVEARFQPVGATKLQFESPRPFLAARWGDTLWTMTGDLVEGRRIPEPPFKTPPVEIYHQGRERDNYVELELMSPAVRLEAGRHARFVVTWSLHRTDDAHGPLPDAITRGKARVPNQDR